MSDKAFRPTVQRIAIPRGGRIDSAKLDTFFGQTADDIVSMAQFVTEQASKVEAQATASADADRDLRGRMEQLEAEIRALRASDAVANRALVHALTLFDSRNFQFLDDADIARRCAVDTSFGQATLPFDGIEPRLYQESVGSGAVIPIEDLAVTVTGTFDAGDGNGVFNHERGGDVDAGEPLNAFNGNNNSRWVREVSFPLYSDVDSVMCEITVDVPEGSGGLSNIVGLRPDPAGDVDIMGVYTAPDLGDSFTLLTGFEEVEGAGPKRWIFPTKAVQRVKVRLRQRNWIEKDGKKVFRLGLQELSLSLAEFDKTYSGGNPLSDNDSVVLKKKAPDGWVFNTLTSLLTDPDYLLETAGQRHVHIKVATDPDGSTIVWDSDSDAPPQDGAGVSLGSTFDTLYFIVTMNWVATSGGISSPFPVGTTPYFHGITFEAMVEEA